jgi:hypothetical protein
MCAGCSAQQAMELEQLQSERFDLVQHAAERGLVWEVASQQRVLVPRLSCQGRERAQRCGPQVAANTDFVVLPLQIALLAGLGITSGMFGAW